MAYVEHIPSRTTGTNNEDPDSRILALFREWLAAYPALKSAYAAVDAEVDADDGLPDPNLVAIEAERVLIGIARKIDATPARSPLDVLVKLTTRRLFPEWEEGTISLSTILPDLEKLAAISLPDAESCMAMFGAAPDTSSNRMQAYRDGKSEAIPAPKFNYQKQDFTALETMAGDLGMWFG